MCFSHGMSFLFCPVLFIKQGLVLFMLVHLIIIFVSKTGNGADLLIHEATLEDELKAEALAKKHRFCLQNNNYLTFFVIPCLPS